MSDKPKGPYTLWRNLGYEGWSPTDYQSYHGALMGERYGETFVVQRAVNYSMLEDASLRIKIASRVEKVVALGGTIDCDAIAAAAIAVLLEHA